MQILKLQIHSFIDVITNSSTELFVTDGTKTVTFIEELLEEKWSNFRELYEYGSKELGSILKIVEITKDNFKKIEKDVYWDFSDVRECKVGDIIIIGTEDNSIPWEFFDVIEKFLNVQRYHLG